MNRTRPSRRDDDGEDRKPRRGDYGEDRKPRRGYDGEDRERRDNDGEDRKPKVPKECPWCGSSKKRPKNHNEDGTCNEHCRSDYAHYREVYEMPELQKRRR